jgi:urease accessory protein
MTRNHKSASLMFDSDMQLLRLLQLTDSALPVGGAAQSFGIESLVAERLLTVQTLEHFLHGYLGEAGCLEAWHCRAGAHIGARAAHGQDVTGDWIALNAQLSALKPARETRAASLMLGRRLLHLFGSLEAVPDAGRPSYTYRVPVLEGHYSCAVGFCAGLLGVSAHAAALAYLQQSLTGLISVCQRLMQLGQTDAMRLSWRLKPQLAAAAMQSGTAGPPHCCVAQLEIASMRHAGLETRMFIS